MAKALTITDFLLRARAVHGDKYDYRLVKYSGIYRKVKILCPTHGVFEQLPKNHWRKDGCPNCKRTAVSDFIIKARGIHGERYDYSRVFIKNVNVHIEIICPDHGSFLQTPMKHLYGNGCAKCGFIAMAEKRRKTLAVFLEQARKIHGDRYSYKETNYGKNEYTHVKIICKLHGPFWQSPGRHLSGQNCPSCSKAPYSNLANKFFSEVISSCCNIDKNQVNCAQVNGERKIGRYRPDLTYENKIIEVYGDYFHMHHLNKYDNVSMGKRRKYDRRRMAFIRRKGYRTLVIWEREIKTDRKKAIGRAKKFLES